MKTVTGIVLLLLAVATAAHPYSPYTDHKGDSKGEELSEDAVAAYLKSKMDVENLKPAKIMEYVETLLQGGEKSTTEAPAHGLEYVETLLQKEKNMDTVCVLNGGTDRSLKMSTLKTVLNTIYPTTDTFRPKTTILTPDHGRNVYSNNVDNPLEAYRLMLDSHPASAGINHIWASYSPCPACARRLITNFKDEENHKKPTLHVAGIYSNSSDLSDNVQSLQCLAKLQHEGFDIVLWNFNQFKAAETTPLHTDCIQAITTAYGKANFTSAVMELEIHVRFIQQLGSSSHANSWCEG